VRRAVFIDALGTLLRLEPPWENAPAAIGAGLDPERVRDAFLAEIAYYMPRSSEGRDQASLADLRRRCAAVLSRELGRPVPVEAMMQSIRFRAFDDVVPALRALRERRLQLVCVSNWDCSLPEALRGAGVAGLLDGVVTSAAAGARKPDPAIFSPALELAGCEPDEALHVGDSDDDLLAARAAGIEALRIDRSARPSAGRIASLLEIGEHLE
jgi:FMN phosphatase YigB (HAD superfamily)